MYTIHFILSFPQKIWLFVLKYCMLSALGTIVKFLVFCMTRVNKAHCHSDILYCSTVGKFWFIRSKLRESMHIHPKVKNIKEKRRDWDQNKCTA